MNTNDCTLRVMTTDGILVDEFAYSDEYDALEDLDSTVEEYGEDHVVQVILNDMIYAEVSA